MSRPGIRIAFAVTLAVAFFVGLTLTWVPAGQTVLAWNATSGALRVIDSGVSFLPRWQWQRRNATDVHIELGGAAADDNRVTLALTWAPPAGTYHLTSESTLESGLHASAGVAVRALVATVELACFAPPDLGISAAGCSPDLAAELAATAAAACGAVAQDFEISYSLEPTVLRSLVSGAIVEKLRTAERRVLVLGLDGLDWDLVDPWIGAGLMPNLQRLREAGAWGTMETLVPTLSPLIWTTLATGVSPDIHGILDFVERDPERDILLPITGRSRKVPAIWNIASELGRSVGVVGWWATWPAETIRGVMVSDRLYYTLTQGISEAVFRNDPPFLVTPEERTAEMLELRSRATEETDWSSIRSFMDIPRDRFEGAVASNLGMEDPVDGFRRILAASRTYLGAGLRVAAEKPDLLMVYLEGTDTIGHLLAPYVAPPTIDVDADEAATYVAAVERYFRIVDRWIGRYLELYPLDESAIVIVSDHGFTWSDKRPRGVSGTAGPTAPLWHEADAVFVAAGAGIENRGRVDRGASVYDLAPTIATLLGLPTDAAWQGSVLPGTPSSDLDAIDYRQLVPPTSYRSQLANDEVPVDPEFIDKLRSLGYLSGGGAAADSGAALETTTKSDRSSGTAAGDDRSATRGELNNLAVVNINQGNYDEAERLLRKAIAQSPEYPSPHYNLRRIYMETKRYDEADRELWLAVSKGLRDPERTIDRAAADYDNLDLQERSVGILATAIDQFPEHEPFWVHLLVARIRLGQCDEGVEDGAEAARRFEGSAPVHAFWGLAAGCAGDIESARHALKKSLEINPEQPKIRGALADLGR